MRMKEPWFYDPPHTTIDGLSNIPIRAFLWHLRKLTAWCGHKNPYNDTLNLYITMGETYIYPMFNGLHWAQEIGWMSKRIQKKYHAPAILWAITSAWLLPSPEDSCHE